MIFLCTHLEFRIHTEILILKEIEFEGVVIGEMAVGNGILLSQNEPKGAQSISFSIWGEKVPCRKPGHLPWPNTKSIHQTPSFQDNEKGEPLLLCEEFPMLFILFYSYCNRSLDRLSWGNSIHSWQFEYTEVQNTFHCERKVSFPSHPSHFLPPYSSIHALSREIQHLPLNVRTCRVWLSDSRTNKSSPLLYQFLELWNK